jgi:hypothetical protein
MFIRSGKPIVAKITSVGNNETKKAEIIEILKFLVIKSDNL